MIAEYEDCESTVENFWKNMKTIDPLHDLKLNCSIMTDYFSNYEENNNKTLKDFECELRSHNLDVGLIAAEFNDDEKELIKNGTMIFIKPQYAEMYYSKKNKKDIPDEYLSKYKLIYSCRSRDDVIKETLQHSATVEENLEKLLDAGIGICADTPKLEPSKNMSLLSEKEKTFMNDLRKGRKLIKLKKLDLEKEFKEVYAQHNKAELMMVSMLNNGGPVFGLVEENKLVSNIGVHMYYNSDGKQVNEYVLI